MGHSGVMSPRMMNTTVENLKVFALLAIFVSPRIIDLHEQGVPEKMTLRLDGSRGQFFFSMLARDFFSKTVTHAERFF